MTSSLLDLSRARIGSRVWSNGRIHASGARHVGSRLGHSFATPSAGAGPHVPLYDPNAPDVSATKERRPRMSRSSLGALPVRTPAKETLSSRDNPFAELQRRVEMLQETLSAETTQASDAVPDPDTPPFSEEELLSLYEDVLALPDDGPRAIAAPDEVAPEQRDLQLVQGVYERLFPQQELGSSSELEPNMLKDMGMGTTAQQSITPIASTSTPLHVTVLSRIRDVVSSFEASKGFDLTTSIPVALLSQDEWTALTNVAIREHDGDAMESSLDLMKRTGVVPSEELLSSAMNVYANAGNVVRTEAFMARFLTESPSERQRDLHVKAHIRSVPQYTIPHSALSLLHTYESRAQPAPIKTYSRAINSLFAVRPTSAALVPASADEQSTVQAHAQAWDLFAHMRYAAHAKPDLALYTQMIRACALPASGRTSPFSPLPTAEPERALDLWTEMTVDARLAPDVHAYEAIIAACARSGQTPYVDEAFRLARECLDGERDARGRPRFAATPAMCRALLDGAKRVGALGRARWILAEMVRVARSGSWAAPTGRAGDVGDAEPIVDEQAMMHVFHAYAAYRPPFRRGLARIVDGQTPENELDPKEAIQEARSTPEGSSIQADAVPDAPDVPLHKDLPHNFLASRSPTEMNIADPSFPSHVPQSRGEVLAEASFLFSRILDSQSGEGGSADEALDARDFAHVQITPRLVESYLAVYYAHASTDACRSQWAEAWARVAHAATPTARNVVKALEQCANARRGRDREAALTWAEEELWPTWEPAEQAWRRGDTMLAGMDSRLVERAQAAMIRLCATTGQRERALALLRGFVAAYPPLAVRAPARPLDMRSTRTVLVGARPLVRLTAPAHVPDDAVPPLLTFADIEVLHHRCVAAGDAKGVGLVHWVCKAYEGELRRRRERTMMALEEKREAEKREAKKSAVAAVAAA